MMSLKQLKFKNCKTTECFQTVSYIDKLNEDCLIKIFEYLPVIDRVRSEAVSKKWQGLIQKSWSNFKHFDLKVDNAKYDSKKRFNIVIDDKVFKNLMNRFGRYLRSIDLNYIDIGKYRLTSDSIRCIGQSCTKLQTLNLGRIFLRWTESCDEKEFSNDSCECEPRLSQIIQALQDWKILSNLTKFAVRVNHANLNSLLKLISRMKKLESLHIEFLYYVYPPDMTISGLPFSTLNEIIFQECVAIEEDHLIAVVKSVQNLCTLILRDLRSFKVIHSLLPSQRKDIKNLCVDVPDYVNGINLDLDIYLLQGFVNLKRLNLSLNRTLVTNEFVETISNHCKELIFLDISSNFYVTDIGIQHIASLPKLQYLCIDYLNKVKGETLNEMGNLEVLSCFGCIRLEEEGLCAAIKQSKLRFIDLYDCTNITNKFLQAVVEELNTQIEKMDLHIMIINTEINVNEIEKIPSQLHIVDSPAHMDELKKLYDYFPKTEFFIYNH